MNNLTFISYQEVKPYQGCERICAHYTKNNWHQCATYINIGKDKAKWKKANEAYAPGNKLSKKEKNYLKKGLILWKMNVCI